MLSCSNGARGNGQLLLTVSAHHLAQEQEGHPASRAFPQPPVRPRQYQHKQPIPNKPRMASVGWSFRPLIRNAGNLKTHTHTTIVALASSAPQAFQQLALLTSDDERGVELEAVAAKRGRLEKLSERLNVPLPPHVWQVWHHVAHDLWWRGGRGC